MGIPTLDNISFLTPLKWQVYDIKSFMLKVSKRFTFNTNGFNTTEKVS